MMGDPDHRARPKGVSQGELQGIGLMEIREKRSWGFPGDSLGLSGLRTRVRTDWDRTIGR